MAVESEPGRGTTFTLYLPKIAGEVTAQSAAIREGRDFPTGDGQCVLIVEDNVEVGRFATQILEDIGYRTTWAANAEDDAKVLAALKKGGSAVLTARSAKGTQTQDTFSLRGFTAAMTEAGSRCK